MKTLEEFNQFYKFKLKGRLIDLDKERLAIKHRLIRMIVLIVGGAIAFIVVSEYSDIKWYQFFSSRSSAVLFGSFGLAVVLLIYGLVIFFPYRMKFKDAIVKEILAFIGYPLVFNPSGKLDEEMVRISKLFHLPSGTRVTSEDLITGEIDGFKISFANISVILPDEKNRDPKLATRFDGVFLVADSPKEVKTDIQVTDKMFGGIVLDPRDFFVPDHELVTDIDEDSFKERFLIYCKDYEWKEVLSQPLRIWLTNFRRQRQVQVSFIKNKIFATFTFDKNKDPVEPSLFKPADDFEKLKSILVYFLVGLSLADALRKNSL